MAGKTIFYIGVILQIFSHVVYVQNSKLNVPRVLLPIFTRFSINFTLEASEGGCYKWTTSRYDIVQLTPLFSNHEQECSSRAVVSSVSKEAVRNTAIVLAEEQYTGQILRCDVIVDVIHSLDIVTTTRELFMEEAPEAFEVRAYDDQGNEFTTLKNVQFDWSLTSSGGGKDTEETSVLRFMTFRDSPYETPATVQEFEEQGLRGHIVLLEGVKTGSAKVSVKLPYPEYASVPITDVALMVVANLIIEPADVYILRGDMVQYKVIQVKHGRLEQINLGSSQYYLDVEDKKIGVIDRNSGVFTGLDKGKTRIVLRDRHVKHDNDASMKLPSCGVSVTYPGYISLSILPHRNWAILQGEEHEIIVEVFATNDHKIHLGSGIKLETKVDENLFAVIEQSANGSWIHGKAIVQGSTPVDTTLVHVVSHLLGIVKLQPQLKAHNDLLIFPQISLRPNEGVFPWDPSVQPKYEVKMRASGGDGKFVWSSTNHTVGIITQLGLAKTYWHGQYDVCASMARNHKNRKCARFFIIPPTKLEIVEFGMENQIGSPIFLHIALFAERPGISSPGNAVLIPFTRCDKLHFKVKPSDHNFVYNQSMTTELVGVSCHAVAIVGLGMATSRVTVSYVRDYIHIEDNVTVSAYRPLKVIHPASGETTLALGTSRNIIFTGGPRPWMGHSSEHTYKLESSDSEVIKINNLTDFYKVAGESDTYVINILCKKLGETRILITVANKPLFPNCRHQESFASVTVHCSHPHMIFLQPEIKSDTNSCPMDLSSDRVVVQSYRDIELVVTVKDNTGRVFDNITSFHFEWEVSPVLLGTASMLMSVVPRNYTYGDIMLPDGHFQVIIPQSQAGVLEVTATIVGYLSNVLKVGKVTGSSDHFKHKDVSTKITLYLVDDTVVVPNQTSIYNHPENKHFIAVKQGSGFYELSLSSDDYADVRYIESLRQIEVLPRKNGELQLSLKDLCLKAGPAVIVVRLVSVAALQVQMTDKVEIGKCIEAVVKFYDDSDSLMPLPKLDYLDIRYIMEDDIVNIKLMETDPKEPWGVGEVHYLVSGVELGDTQLVFAAGRGDKEVVSAPVSIQVFAPIRLVPKNVTMFIGSTLQLAIQGGPQPDANLEYGMETENIVEINQIGVLKGLALGHTIVVARSVGTCPFSGQKIVHGQDVADVYVVPLIGVKIMIPLTRFMQGSTVPAWFTGLPEYLSPILFGAIHPPFIVSWGSNCDEIIAIKGIFQHLGVKYDASEQISIRLKGVRPGRCTLELNVTVPGATAGMRKKKTVKHSSTIDLEVFEELQLTKPEHVCGKSILLAPYSQMQLETNRDGFSMLSYSLQEENFRESQKASSQGSNSVVTISDSGMLKSYGIIGRAMVIITALDDHGLRQSITLVVQVKPIHYMMASVVTDWFASDSGIINTLPIGSELTLSMTYYDNTGAPFTAATVDLRFRSNRFDLVEMKRGTQNASIIVYPIKPGSSVIKVWADGTTKTADYLNIAAKQLINPGADTVVSGDVFCLSSPVVNQYWQLGMWYSDDDDILRINYKTGVGQVLSARTGMTAVTYSLTPSVKVHFKVESPKFVVMKYDPKHIVSNENPPNRIPFLLTGSKTRSTKRSNLLSNFPCEHLMESDVTFFPYHCHIFFRDEPYNIESVFKAVPAFVKEKGYFACDIVPVAATTPNISVISSNITLVVILENELESEPVDLVYLPSVYVPVTEMYLSDTDFTGIISITGLPIVLEQVKLESVDTKLILIGEPEQISPTTVNYEIKLIDYHWKFPELDYPLYVTVVSKDTSQRIKIKVLTSLGQDQNSKSLCMAQNLGSPAGNFFYHHRHTLTVILSMLILFFVTFYAYSHYIQPVINVNVVPGRSLLNTTVSGQIPDRPLMLNSTYTNTTMRESPNRPYCNAQNCLNPQNCMLSHRSGSPASPYTALGESDLNRTYPDYRRNRRFI